MKKFNPSKENLLSFFQDMIKTSMWRGAEVSKMIKLNLERYGMADDYKWFMDNINDN